LIEFSGELLFAEKEVSPRPFKKHGLRLRRSVYWLNTLLLHVRAFKTRNYARATEELVEKIKEIAG
jgi:hypothetical protein